MEFTELQKGTIYLMKVPKDGFDPVAHSQFIKDCKAAGVVVVPVMVNSLEDVKLDPAEHISDLLLTDWTKVLSKEARQFEKYMLKPYVGTVIGVVANIIKHKVKAVLTCEKPA